MAGSRLSYVGGFCSICGAHIYPNKQEKHTNFHTEHNELVEWAQSVSELFKSDTTTLAGGLGEILNSLARGVITPREAMDRAGIKLQEGPENKNEMEV